MQATITRTISGLTPVERAGHAETGQEETGNTTFRMATRAVAGGRSPPGWGGEQ